MNRQHITIEVDKEKDLKVIEKQCAIIGVSIRFSRKQYDKRRIPELYFTKDYTIKNSVLYIKGDEYSPYMWSYDRMIGLIKDGILSENYR